jgi:hypothetical protein
MRARRETYPTREAAETATQGTEVHIGIRARVDRIVIAATTANFDPTPYTATQRGC